MVNKRGTLLTALIAFFATGLLVSSIAASALARDDGAEEGVAEGVADTWDGSVLLKQEEPRSPCNDSIDSDGP